LCLAVALNFLPFAFFLPSSQMPEVTTEYISAGGNRHSAAADWSVESGILAFGADTNVALWRPLDEDCRGIFTLLSGHKAKVNAIRYLHPSANFTDEIIVSGDANGEIRTFRCSKHGAGWDFISAAQFHDGAINCIASLSGSHLFVTGGADATFKVWRHEDGGSLTLLHTTHTKPRYIPLGMAFGRFKQSESVDTAFLAAGGTRNEVFVYSLQDLLSDPKVELTASLKGHEGWIRSLALRSLSNGDQLLASGSADKYVRLWKFSSRQIQSQPIQTDPADIAVYQNTLTAKIQKVSVPSAGYNITFEALLLGHEDWVYSTAWNPYPENLQLLTASADGTLTIWEPEPTSGIWVSASRLGEISGQKGATTATGSTGGFWNALWSLNGEAVTCLGRTGSWRLWQYDSSRQYWVQTPAVSGHVGSVNSITWASDGSYLLSTSSDQTTRLHAEWRRGTKRTWHEFARPQIHGYDLNCITSTTPTQFASGADEKLLRVFDEPKAIANMLHRLCHIDLPDETSLPDSAAMPVLGLSNKAIDETNGDMNDGGDAQFLPPDLESSLEDAAEPPVEDLLARHTLWPEREKLYGHGYEISEAAVNEDHSLIATSCKASSLDHAVIRLYDTKTWSEVRPPLAAHTLTVTRLAWSQSPNNYLLSVGRDRQWAVFARASDSGEWRLHQANPKAHSRMILDAAWSSVRGVPFFATAGRDKTVKIWNFDPSSPKKEFKLNQPLSRKSAVTAVALTSNIAGTETYMAVGEENGEISVHELGILNDGALTASHELSQTSPDVPLSRAVQRLAWRPSASRYEDNGSGMQLAVAGADGSVRILRIPLEFTRNDEEQSTS
jgi:elongator complex protein 2